MADFSERMASLNTQMRFKRWKDAMPIAYSLRLDLQLASSTPKIAETLKIVEEIIEQLEKTKVGPWARFVKKVQYTLDPDSREEEEAEAEEEEEEEEEGGQDSAEESPGDGGDR